MGASYKQSMYKTTIIGIFVVVVPICPLTCVYIGKLLTLIIITIIMIIVIIIISMIVIVMIIITTLHRPVYPRERTQGEEQLLGSGHCAMRKVSFTTDLGRHRAELGQT